MLCKFRVHVKHWRLHCLQVTLVDTAGLRESTDDIERMGMERARSAMTSADIIALVLDLQSEPEMAAALQQQQQTPARAHDKGAGAEDTIIAIGRRLIEEVVGLDHNGHPTSDGEQQVGPESRRERMALEEQDCHSAVSRPQHQKTLLVLNKSDLQPLPQQSLGMTAPMNSDRLPGSSQVRSNGACAAELSTEALPQRGEASASGAGSYQPDRVVTPEADAVRTEQSKSQVEGTADDMAGAVAISCRTGEGLDRLLARLSEVVANITEAGDADGAIITRCCQLPVSAPVQAVYAAGYHTPCLGGITSHSGI